MYQEWPSFSFPDQLRDREPLSKVCSRTKPIFLFLLKSDWVMELLSLEDPHHHGESACRSRCSSLGLLRLEGSGEALDEHADEAPDLRLHGGIKWAPWLLSSAMWRWRPGAPWFGSMRNRQLRPEAVLQVNHLGPNVLAVFYRLGSAVQRSAMPWRRSSSMEPTRGWTGRLISFMAMSRNQSRRPARSA